MRSSATPRFWKCYAALPRTTQQQAREGYAFFGQDPYHPSLRFKRVHSARPIFSVRISLEYRALGIVAGHEITWFWIGSHAEYDRILKSPGNA